MTPDQVLWLLRVVEAMRDLLIVLVTEMSIVTLLVYLRATDRK